MKAIITGQTRGLGAAIAENLLARNIAVLGLSRGSNAALAAQYPSTLQQVQLDLSDCSALADWLAGDGMSRFLAGSETALLINNAGLLSPVGPVQLQDIGAIAKTVSVNVAAPMMLTAALAQVGVGDRRVLHVSSGAGRSAYPGWSIYCATKAALDHHARAVVLDQTPALRICSLAPGVIDTDMQAQIRASTPEQFPLRERFHEMKRQGGLSSPQDCAARLVDYLLSENFGQVPVADLRELSE